MSIDLESGDRVQPTNAPKHAVAASLLEVVGVLVHRLKAHAITIAELEQDLVTLGGIVVELSEQRREDEALLRELLGGPSAKHLPPAHLDALLQRMHRQTDIVDRALARLAAVCARREPNAVATEAPTMSPPGAVQPADPPAPAARGETGAPDRGAG